MHPPLDAARLAEALVAQGPYARVEVVERIDSTNAELLRRAATPAGPAHMTALLAEHQTQGRGRQHPAEPAPRAWIAPPRTSLIASVLVKPPLEAAPRRTMLGLVWALAAAETLDLLLPGQAGLKWPNDLMLAGRKLAGVLAGGTGGGEVVVGIGLNVHQTEEELPDGRAGSVALAGAPDVDRTWLAIAVLSSAATWYERWADGDPRLLGRAGERMAALGRLTRVALPDGQTVAGLAEGLEADGSLRLRLPDGSALAVGAGELA
ncbi:MAG: biotin--[acetyl-CoA-carboxylase] ligase [Bifidobacteriaceae bacterium]|nr:biotin--[acetyl-CoA-carboxylase] ligase [Bifidobacteriaceae bacterium]